MKKRFYLFSRTVGFLLVLSFSLAACGSPVTVGSTRTGQLIMPVPNDPTGPYNLSLQTHQATISFGTTENNLYEGSFLYNAPELKPGVQTESNHTRITEPIFQGDLPEGAKSEWKLNLNPKVPLNLDFETGKTSGAYNLGGLSLKGLNYTQDGGDSRLYFSQPNRLDLENLAVEITSSKLLVAGLSEAHLQTATFICKEGDLSLDFFKDNGKLERPVQKVLVKGKNSNLTLFTAPIPAEIVLDAGEQSQVSAGNWTKSGRTYRNAAWGLAGPDDFKLTIHVELNGGHLYLY
ncbi:MAG: hypothetical protein J0I20_17190 [Chloroflexi bacterium]|nr:hypothetical protein [Chloroflexota bacterium]OJV88177.1 MAG: hypothetical protein BGO39_08255 [Chloroflexi bacterium 54-19]